MPAGFIGWSIPARISNSINAYSQLCTLLTIGNLRAEKGDCHLYKKDVFEYADEFKLIAIPPTELNDHFEFDPSFKIAISEYRKVFGANLYLAATRHYFGDDAKQTPSVIRNFR